LGRGGYPHGGEKGRETKETLADGSATFEAVREWRVETLMIHGAEEYFWNWCVAMHRSPPTEVNTLSYD
jgi:hypothetical protein